MKTTDIPFSELRKQTRITVTLDNESHLFNEGIIQSLLQVYSPVVVALRSASKELKAIIDMNIPCYEKLSLQPKSLKPKSLIRLPKFNLPQFGYNLLREVLRHNFHSTHPPIRLKVWDYNIKTFIQYDSILSILKNYKPTIYIETRSEENLKACIIELLQLKIPLQIGIDKCPSFKETYNEYNYITHIGDEAFYNLTETPDFSSLTKLTHIGAVSYTHLTLPTILLV